MHTKRRNIKNEIIRAKGIKLMNEANLLLPEEKKIILSSRTVGWVSSKAL